MPDDEWFTTKVPGPNGVNGLVVIDPENMEFFNNSSYDFGAWRNVVKHTGLATKGKYVQFAEDYGHGDVWTYQDGKVPKGISWYKMTLPFC